MSMDKFLALRIDVDTLRGTKCGVPALNETLAEFGIKATYYFSVGPDNMGRHLWRLLKPAFLWKMLRTNAAGLYGLDIILMGTAWPGPEIGKRCADIIRDSAAAGHEIGFHAWDHQKSQSKIDRMSPDELNAELSRGIGKLEEIIGKFPLSSATPGWRTNDALLLKKDAYPFEFNSDCRGDGIFYPVVDGRKLKVLQIPVTMPTYDEALGRDGVTEANYNDRMIQLLRPGKLNVLTIHAEAEGGKCRQMFREFLARVQEEGWEVGPLGKVAAEGKATAPEGEIIQAPFPGREGWLACQKSTEEKA